MTGRTITPGFTATETTNIETTNIDNTRDRE